MSRFLIKSRNLMTRWLLFCMAAILIALTSACTTRQVVDDFAGATAQRLTAYSVDELMRKLPEEDFSLLKGKRVFLACHFLEEIHPLEYAKQRLALELMDTYGCTVTDDPEMADMRLEFFFTAIGTNHDKAGFKTPDFAVPGMSVMSIDLLTLDMFHGICEGYYYILNPEGQVLARGDKVKSVIRTDRIGLPIITIPVNDLD